VIKKKQLNQNSARPVLSMIWKVPHNAGSVLSVPIALKAHNRYLALVVPTILIRNQILAWSAPKATTALKAQLYPLAVLAELTAL
jgi:hypothetical protein